MKLLAIHVTSRSQLRVGLILGACFTLLGGCQQAEKTSLGSERPSARVTSAQAHAPQVKPAVRTSIGFRSSHNLDDHFAKHGREFPGMSKAEYLHAAQTLRDSPVGGDIEQIVRSDGSESRFDKGTGSFLAFNRDGTIRTFFRPNDGERYFRRQAQRSH